jgi:toxin CcdB
MAQFDVYRLAGGELAIDVQTTLISDFNSRVVIPLLRPHDAPVAHQRLNPTVEIEGERFVVVTQFIIAVDRAELGAPVAMLPLTTTALRTPTTCSSTASSRGW